MTLIIFGASLPALGTFTDWNIDIHITTTTAENNQTLSVSEIDRIDLNIITGRYWTGASFRLMQP